MELTIKLTAAEVFEIVSNHIHAQHGGQLQAVKVTANLEREYNDRQPGDAGTAVFKGLTVDCGQFERMPCRG